MSNILLTSPTKNTGWDFINNPGNHKAAKIHVVYDTNTDMSICSTHHRVWAFDEAREMTQDKFLNHPLCCLLCVRELETRDE